MAATDGGRQAPARWRRPLALVALAALPWTVVPLPGGTSLVFPWGLVTLDPLVTTSLPDYLRYTSSLPRRLRAWPISTLLYAGALALASVGVRWPQLEDRRVTGGLLVLAGASSLLVATGLVGVGVPALPVGPVAVWAAAWWFHAADLRAAVG